MLSGIKGGDKNVSISWTHIADPTLSLIRGFHRRTVVVLLDFARGFVFRLDGVTNRLYYYYCSYFYATDEIITIIIIPFFALVFVSAMGGVCHAPHNHRLENYAPASYRDETMRQACVCDMIWSTLWKCESIMNLVQQREKQNWNKNAVAIVVRPTRK